MGRWQMAKSPSYPKTIKISVPYEFKIANKDTYEFLKRNLSVSNLTALQTSVKDYLEEYLKIMLIILNVGYFIICLTIVSSILILTKFTDD